MQQFCTYGSVRGAAGNRRPYRDPLMFMKTESGDHGGPQNICIKLKQWRGFQRKKLPAASPMLEFR